MRSSYKRRRKRKMWKKIRRLLLMGAILILFLALLLWGYNFIRFRGKSDVEKQVLKHPWRYPKELVYLMKENPETQNFVAGYKENREKPLQILLSKKETKETLPYFLQWDRRWGYTQYNDNYFAITGSAPTCLSMVSVSLSQNPLATPFSIAQYIEEHKYLSNHNLKDSFMTDGISYFDIQGMKIETDFQSIKKSLDKGQLLIACLSDENFLSLDETKHYVVVYKLDQNEKLYILDPNSKENSNKTWSYEQLSSHLLSIWEYSPLS